jgi:pterin-4a-carbinolamine dehydratase
MMAGPVPEGWNSVGPGGSLCRRFEFEAYAATRDFLDRLAGLSERLGRYPDLSFGKRHVNVTIHGEAERADAASLAEFASAVANLAAGGGR